MNDPTAHPHGRWAGVPDTGAARAHLEELAGDDCPWQVVDAALDEIDRLRAQLAECDAAVGLYERQAAVVADRSAADVLAEYLELLFPGRENVPETHAGAILDWLAEHGFIVSQADTLPPGVDRVERAGVVVERVVVEVPPGRLGSILEELVAQLAADGSLRHACTPLVTDEEVSALAAWLYPNDSAFTEAPLGTMLDDCCLAVWLPPGVVPLLTVPQDEVDPIAGDEMIWPAPRTYWSNGTITDGASYPVEAS